MWRRTAKNKYNAVKTTVMGRTYASKFEATCALLFEQKRREGKITKIEEQVRMPLICNKKKVCTYIVDFRLTIGRKIEYVEAKGKETDVFKIKMKMFRAIYKEPLIVVNTKTVTSYIASLDKRTE